MAQFHLTYAINNKDISTLRSHSIIADFFMLMRSPVRNIYTDIEISGSGRILTSL